MTKITKEQQLRQDLAAAFRWAVRYDLHEASANHFSMAVSDDGSKFLINPALMHFQRIKASDLLLLDSNDPKTMDRPNAPDPTAWQLHSYIHKYAPKVKCIIHTHSPYITALASLKDPTIYPIDQNTARFFNKTAYDLSFGGMVLDDSESERVLKLSENGNKKVIVMGAHGVMILGESIAEAFDLAYYVEVSAKNLMLVYQSGKEFDILNDNVASETERQWDLYQANGVKFCDGHFRELKLILDEEGSDYKD